MQIIKASRDAILKPLQTVAGIVEKRHTLPILANVLIRKTGEVVSFTGTDIEMQVQTRASIGSGGENAAVTVSARKLMDILRALPESEVTVTLNGTKLAVSAGKSRFALQTLPAADFPTLAVGTEVTSEATLPQKQLKNLLQMVDLLPGAPGDPDPLAVLGGLLGDPGGLAVRADDHHVGDVDRGLLGDDPPGLRTPLVLADPGVLLDPVHALDQDAVTVRVGLDDLALGALVLAGDHHHGVALLDLHQSTSGAREMIFMNRLSRSSRPTGPKMRVPRGSPSGLISTAAFSSNRM